MYRGVTEHIDYYANFQSCPRDGLSILVLSSRNSVLRDSIISRTGPLTVEQYYHSDLHPRGAIHLYLGPQTSTLHQTHLFIQAAHPIRTTSRTNSIYTTSSVHTAASSVRTTTASLAHSSYPFERTCLLRTVNQGKPCTRRSPSG